MKNKKEVNLGKQISFAIEMVRGALRKMRASDILLETSIELPSQVVDGHRFQDRYIPITADTFSGKVFADYFIDTEAVSPTGDIEIRYFVNESGKGSHYHFRCQLTNKGIAVQPA